MKQVLVKELDSTDDTVETGNLTDVSPSTAASEEEVKEEPSHENLGKTENGHLEKEQTDTVASSAASGLGNGGNEKVGTSGVFQNVSKGDPSEKNKADVLECVQDVERSEAVVFKKDDASVSKSVAVAEDKAVAEEKDDEGKDGQGSDRHSADKASLSTSEKRVCQCDTVQTWVQKIREKLKDEEILDETLFEFSKCKTDVNRLACLYMLPAVHSVIKVEECFKGKSEEEAKDLRTSGNKLFKKKQFQDSLEMYSKCILKAPVSADSNELSLAFANRSAVHYHLKQYVLCLQDIKLSLKQSYPEHLQYKLLERRGKCFYHMRMKDEAQVAFQEAVVLLDKANLDELKLESVSSELNKQIQQCNKIKSGVEIKTVKDFNRSCGPIPKLEGKPSLEIPCMSDKIVLKYTKEQGRGLFADKDIEVGEVIIIEEPYSSVLMPAQNLTHCHHCCNRVVSPLPCQQCSGVIFCSEECQTSAWGSYHYAECKFLDLIQRSDVGLGHLALRMVLKAGYKYLKEYGKSLDGEETPNSNPLMQGFNQNGIYDSADYHAVYNLVKHSQKRSSPDLIKRTVNAIFLLKCLEQTSFFRLDKLDAESLDSILETDLDEKHTFIGGHILRHIQMLPCNAHEVSELALNPNNTELSETMEIGSAIYAALSLINHSCDPSVVRHSYGDTCIVRAIQNIPRGQELFDSYGTLYPLTKLEQRQEKLLSQYYFHCSCEPCMKNWPLYFDIPEEMPVIKCKTCLGPVFVPDDGHMQRAICCYCREVQDISRQLLQLSLSADAYQDALQKVLKGKDRKESLPVLVNHLCMLDPVICRPWREYNNCQEAIKQCYSEMANCFVQENTEDDS